jgi:CRISPR type I-E-associated protein CasB/Cse2
MKTRMSPSAMSAIGILCERMNHDSGIGARLRRAAGIDDVLGFEAVLRFATGLRGSASIDAAVDVDDFAAALAILLSYNKIDRNHHDSDATVSGLAARLGGKLGDRRRLSELRFASLIHARTVDTRLRLLRRSLGMLGEKLPALELARGWLQLNNASGRREFARAYFGAADLPAEAGHDIPATETSL